MLRYITLPILSQYNSVSEKIGNQRFYIVM